eukprot:TRINITY_DN19225_c0_g1_i1.p1 TRINITY_DN19225_c0_g1~~TRINITY_DN19225_c0_g1_i1.p1  ORF type:complete len:817 (+),score=201.25 TRINITY_DN19225_c0_g1_i1:44-2494(+)
MGEGTDDQNDCLARLVTEAAPELIGLRRLLSAAGVRTDRDAADGGAGGALPAPTGDSAKATPTTPVPVAVSPPTSELTRDTAACVPLPDDLTETRRSSHGDSAVFFMRLRSRAANVALPDSDDELTEDQRRENAAEAARQGERVALTAREGRHRAAHVQDQEAEARVFGTEHSRGTADASRRTALRKERERAALRSEECDREQQARWDVEQDEARGRKSLGTEGAKFAIVRQEGNLRRRVEGAEDAVRRDIVLLQAPRALLLVSETEDRRETLMHEQRQRVCCGEEGARSLVTTTEECDYSELCQRADAGPAPSSSCPQQQLDTGAAASPPRGRVPPPWRPVGRRREGPFERRLRKYVENRLSPRPAQPSPPQAESRVVDAEPFASASAPQPAPQGPPPPIATLWMVGLEQRRQQKALREMSLIAARQGRAEALREESRVSRTRCMEQEKSASAALTQQARDARRTKLRQQLSRLDPQHVSLRAGHDDRRLPGAGQVPARPAGRLEPLARATPQLQVDRVAMRLKRLERNEAWERRKQRRVRAQQLAAAVDTPPKLLSPLETARASARLRYGAFKDMVSSGSNSPTEEEPSGGAEVAELLSRAATLCSLRQWHEAATCLHRATVATAVPVRPGEVGPGGLVFASERERIQLRVATLNNHACLSLSQGDPVAAGDYISVLRVLERGAGLAEEPRALLNLAVSHELRGDPIPSYRAAHRAHKLLRRAVRTNSAEHLLRLMVAAARQQARALVLDDKRELGSPRSGYRNAVRVACRRLGEDHPDTVALKEECLQFDRGTRIRPVGSPFQAAWIKDESGQ